MSGDGILGGMTDRRFEKIAVLDASYIYNRGYYYTNYSVVFSVENVGYTSEPGARFCDGPSSHILSWVLGLRLSFVWFVFCL